MSTPPDEPTRPLRPGGAPPPRVRERDYAAPVEDDGLWYAELRDGLRSLRTAVLLLGLLAVVALALAAWALLKSGGDSGDTVTRQGASPARVSQLQSRIDDLEAKLGGRATKGQLDDVDSHQKTLSKQENDLSDRIDKLESKSGQSQNAASKDSVDQIQQDVQDLQQRVDDVEKKQQQQQDQSSTP